MSGTIGYQDTNVTTSTGNKTLIALNVGGAASITGYLDLINIRCNGAETYRIKIFRDDGTNYLYIGQYSFSASAGLNTNVQVSPVIQVKAGDLIAFWCAGTRTYGADVADGNMWKAGDITTDSLKSSWTAAADALPLWGTLEPNIKAAIGIGNPYIF